LKQVFRARDVRIDETVNFDPDNSHLDPLMITEVEDLIRIVEITDLPDIAQTDSNYLYEDWDDILASGLGPLPLGSSQRHTIATAPPEVRGYDHQPSTPEATLPTPDPTLRVDFEINSSHQLCLRGLVLESTCLISSVSTIIHHVRLRVNIC